jgi:NADH-quinone oxidoreductase subunit L
MNFFVFSMLLLVLAANLLLLFVGWEGVGVASYFLIGFWYEKPVAAAAAIKAFIVNRVGDLGLMLGLFLTLHLFGTTTISDISAKAVATYPAGSTMITILTLCFFVGAIGKSAQLPLHVWLPDAMAGPTPVSALIHAATMVTAGVYLIVRLHTVFTLAPLTMQVIGVTGGLTALFAALSALAQTDLKRALAYSTVSQLGFMFLACGAGAFYSAMFHLTTHAFVKALLFLSAGNVVHMLHGETEMGKMGGLRKYFPKTAALFLIGALALSGVPPLAAFFSKDMILEQEYLAGFDVLFYLSLISSILTGFYLTRAYCLTFTGKSHLSPENERVAKEAPMVMLIPVTLLGVLAICGGFLGYSLSGTPTLELFLKDLGISQAEKVLISTSFFTFESIMAISAAIIGVGSSALLYTKGQDLLGATLQFLKRSFYVDEIYRLVFAMPLRMIANAIVALFEPYVIQGSVSGVVSASNRVAAGLQRMQSGQIRSYIGWMTLGLAFVIFYFVR